MPNPQPDKSGHGVVYENSSSVAALLRSASSPHRIKIMALAMGEGCPVSEMMEATGLSKTALANHLALLARDGLIERESRGRYRLTPDGRDLLTAAFSTYRRSKRRVEEEKSMIRRGFGMAYGQPDQAHRRLLSHDAKYESCWLSLLGAVSGSLNSLGTRTSVTEVGGYTGYSFLINVSKGETCPSGPTALHIKTFQEMLGGIECLGWRVQNREYPHSYPSRPGAPTDEDLRVARVVFNRVRREIDQRDRPVVLYGLAAPEYGIVRGYDGESYLVSTFRGLQDRGSEEDPVPFHKLNAPGCIDEIYFSEKVRVRPSRARKDALARAVRFAKGDVDTVGNYVSGPQALVEWARVLEEIPDASQNYMGNSYVGACVQEGRAISSSFLKAMSRKVPKPQSRRLSMASTSYSKGAKSMSEFTRLFPFSFEGKMPSGKRRRGAALLRTTMDHEIAAVQHLEKVA